MARVAMIKRNGFVRSRGNNIYPNGYAYLYILPAIVLMLCMCLFPVFVLIYNSFTDYALIRPAVNFVGFENYISFFKSSSALTSVKTTLIYVAVAVTVELILGFVLALLFQVRMPFKKLGRTIMVLPMVATPVAMCYLWSFMFNPKLGILNYLLSLIGIPSQPWVSSPETALWSILMVDAWMYTPFVFLIFSSAMASLGQDYFEAAIVDGAGFMQMLRYIMAPLLKPVLTIVLLFRLIDAFKVFDLIFVLTAGGPGTSTTTMNILIYQNAFNYYRMGYASAIAVVMYLFILALSFVLVKKGGLDFN